MQTYIKEISKSALLNLCEGNSPVTGEFPSQRVSNEERSFHLLTSSWMKSLDIAVGRWMPVIRIVEFKWRRRIARANSSFWTGECSLTLASISSGLHILFVEIIPIRGYCMKSHTQLVLRPVTIHLYPPGSLPPFNRACHPLHRRGETERSQVSTGAVTGHNDVVTGRTGAVTVFCFLGIITKSRPCYLSHTLVIKATWHV